MSGSNFDCYLCGTTNDADADYCSKCSGQLLKLPGGEPATPDASDETPVASGPEDFVSDFLDDDLAHVDEFDAAPPEAPTPSKSRPSPPTMSVNTSVEDMRLSEALGLNDDLDELDELETEVTSIPRARAAENIPHLGTQTTLEGSRTEFHDDEEVSKAAYALLALLFIAVGWLGYDTLLRSAPTPEVIAFNETTTTTTAAPTTTEAPDLSLDPDQVEFLYGPAIVRVVPHACSGGSGEQVGEPLLGVAVNARSTLLSEDFPAEANVAQIITRTASSRLAIVSEEGDLSIATSNVLTTRHLNIEELSDEPFYYVGFEFETNEVTTAESPQGLDAEVSASATGALHQVRIGDTIFDGAELLDIDRSVERVATARSNAVCARAQGLSLVEVITDSDENDSGADPEGADAEEAAE